MYNIQLCFSMETSTNSPSNLGVALKTSNFAPMPASVAASYGLIPGSVSYVDSASTSWYNEICDDVSGDGMAELIAESLGRGG
jgi:hypothetical protein